MVHLIESFVWVPWVGGGEALGGTEMEAMAGHRSALRGTARRGLVVLARERPGRCGEMDGCRAREAA